MQDRNVLSLILGDIWVQAYVKIGRIVHLSFAYFTEYSVYFDLVKKKKKNARGLLASNLSLSDSAKFSHKPKKKVTTYKWFSCFDLAFHPEYLILNFSQLSKFYPEFLIKSAALAFLELSSKIHKISPSPFNSFS